jgi:hypothetical protein
MMFMGLPGWTRSAARCVRTPAGSLDELVINEHCMFFRRPREHVGGRAFVLDLLGECRRAARLRVIERPGLLASSVLFTSANAAVNDAASYTSRLPVSFDPATVVDDDDLTTCCCCRTRTRARNTTKSGAA